MERRTNRRDYHPPVVSDTVALPLDPLLLTESSVVNRMYMIEGHSVDAYYENEDLLTEWGWDGEMLGD